MAVIRCEKCGFHYDDEKYRICPNCDRNDLAEDHTVSLPPEEMEEVLDETVSIDVGFGQDIADDLTVGEHSPLKGESPVVGWLVCVEGEFRGRDFRLHHGWNRMGRSKDRGVYLSGDPKISRENGAIAYDERSSSFYLVNDSGAPIHINGKPLTNPHILRSGDVISLGDSEFVFVPFCTEDRKW